MSGTAAATLSAGRARRLSVVCQGVFLFLMWESSAGHGVSFTARRALWMWVRFHRRHTDEGLPRHVRHIMVAVHITKSLGF